MTVIKLTYSIEEAVTVTALGLHFIHQLLRAGVLKKAKAGPGTLIKADSLEAYINGLPDSRIGKGRGTRPASAVHFGQGDYQSPFKRCRPRTYK